MTDAVNDENEVKEPVKAITLRPKASVALTTPTFKKGRRADQRGVPKARINYRQKARLERDFNRDANWSAEHMTSLSKDLNLSYTKIYKWHYDRKKVEARAGTKVNKEER